LLLLEPIRVGVCCWFMVGSGDFWSDVFFLYLGYLAKISLIFADYS